MKLTIKIESTNEGFASVVDAARALSEIIAGLNDCHTSGKVRDVNGNTIGAWDLSDDDLSIVDGDYDEEDCDYGNGDERDDDSEFADPGGNSALRAAGPGNPRNLPCPNCGAANRLTPADKARGYQCDSCADRAERGCD